jgi:hypothetical protein
MKALFLLSFVIITLAQVDNLDTSEKGFKCYGYGKQFGRLEKHEKSDFPTMKQNHVIWN